MTVSKWLFVVLFTISTWHVVSQEYKLPLYDSDKIPNAIKAGLPDKVSSKDILLLSNVQLPDIAVYLPTKRFATGQAVVICPGGGYWVLAYDLEGTDVAKYLNSIGVAAIVLKYRLPTNGNCTTPHQVPLMDVNVPCDW